MSFFDTALAASGSCQNSIYGETFLVEPRAKADPNGRSSADPARPSTTIVGVWTEPHADKMPTNKTGHPAGEGYKFDTSKPMVDYETVALPFEALLGDFVTRNKTGVRYSIADTDDDGFSRTTLSLTSIRGRT